MAVKSKYNVLRGQCLADTANWNYFDVYDALFTKFIEYMSSSEISKV